MQCVKAAIHSAFKAPSVTQHPRLTTIHEGFDQLYDIIQPYLAGNFQLPDERNIRHSYHRAAANTAKIENALYTVYAEVCDGLHEGVATNSTSLVSVLEDNVRFPRPHYNDSDPVYNAIVIANLLQLVIYGWCSTGAVCPNLTEVSPEEGLITTQWCLLPAIQEWLKSTVRFANHHFRGQRWDHVQELDTWHREAYWMCQHAQQVWDSILCLVEAHIQDTKIRIHLAERELYRKRRLQQPLLLRKASLEKSYKTGSLWIMQRAHTWVAAQATCGYRYLPTQMEAATNWEIYNSIAAITHVQVEKDTCEDRDRLWEFVHPGGLQWPKSMSTNYLPRLEKYFAKLPPIGSVSLQEKTDHPKIARFREVVKCVGLGSSTVEEFTRVLCIMKSSPSYKRIRPQIPWLP